MFNFQVDVTSKEARNNASNAFDSVKFNPKQIVKVKDNYIVQTDNGSVWWNLVVENDQGKTYKMPSKCIVAGNDKNNEEQYAYKELQNLLILMGADGTPVPQTVMVKEWLNNEFVEVPRELPVFVDTIGKRIGVIIRHQQKYPESHAVNGYSNIAIPDRLADPDGYNKAKLSPTTIWMPNYAKKPEVLFDIKLFFDPETEKTLKELQNDNEDETNEVQATYEKIQKMNSQAIKLEPKEWDALRIKKLKANLKKNNEQFNAKLFQPSNDLQGDMGSDIASDVDLDVL